MQAFVYRGAPASGVTRVLALLLVLCLADCATEQRVNRGSKPSNLGPKVNGYRSQRGGSCISYGHSCWGGHGKRSVVPQYSRLVEMIKLMIDHGEQGVLAGRVKSNDYVPFYDDGTDDATNIRPFSIKMKDENRMPLQLAMNRAPEAKPMLDDRNILNMHINRLRQYNPNEE